MPHHALQRRPDGSVTTRSITRKIEDPAIVAKPCPGGLQLLPVRSRVPMRPARGLQTCSGAAAGTEVGREGATQ